MAMTTLLNHLVFILLLSAPAIYADVYTVGDTKGWTLNYDYTAWAAGKNFKIGDSLVFNYFPNAHTVDIVNEADYEACNVANPIKTYSGGVNSINLTAAGSIYFICPVGTHCSQGKMKLAINVAPLTTTPPTTTTPPGSPPPPPSGVDGCFSNLWMLGVSLVAAIAVLGFMG